MTNTWNLEEWNPFFPHNRFFSPSVIDISLGVEVVDTQTPGSDTVPLKEE
jgi:hypothetical protein